MTDTNKMYDRPSYVAPEGDDNRVQWCSSCELSVRTVPAEGVSNQDLRCCEWCGSNTDAD